MHQNLTRYSWVGSYGEPRIQEVPGWLGDGKLRKRLFDVIAYYRDMPKHEPSFWQKLRGAEWIPNQPIDVKRQRVGPKRGGAWPDGEWEYVVYAHGQIVCRFTDNRAFWQQTRRLIELSEIHDDRGWLDYIPEYQHGYEKIGGTY